MATFNINNVKNTIIYSLNNEKYTVIVHLKLINDEWIIVVDSKAFNDITSKPNAIITFLVTTDNGIWLFKATVKNSNIISKHLILQNIKTLKQVQRRNFARIPYCQDMSYSILCSNNKSLTTNTQVDCSILDISICGMALLTSECLFKGDLLMFIISELNNLQVLGEVVYCIKQDNKYKAGINLDINIDEVKNTLAKRFQEIQIQYLYKVHKGDV